MRETEDEQKDAPNRGQVGSLRLADHRGVTLSHEQAPVGLSPSAYKGQRCKGSQGCEGILCDRFRYCDDAAQKPVAGGVATNVTITAVTVKLIANENRLTVFQLASRMP
ncbi:MAG: hypothetical protein MAG451_03162 [Anaerolineales bacterium]|nr:hypothetical protein [Anaerolineales bacterium]